MKIELRWEIIGVKRVLVYEFQASWTWAEFFAIKEKADVMLEAEALPVPLIFDLRHAPNMPPGMLSQSRIVVETRHPKGSPVLLLGANRLIQAAFDIVKRMLGEKTEKFTNDVMLVSTWDEAYAYLKTKPLL